MYSVVILVKAERQLKKLAKRHIDIYPAVEASLTSLANWPEVKGVKRLVNHNYQYRLRVANYRILFDVREEIKVIDVQEVKKRDESTY